MKRLGYQAIFASALLGVAITPAAAQDPDEHWEGAYIGGSFGLGAQNNDRGETILFDTNLDGSFGDTVSTSTSAAAFAPGFCNGAAVGTAPIDCRGDRDGLEYYIRAGYDAQNGNMVYGFLSSSTAWCCSHELSLRVGVGVEHGPGGLWFRTSWTASHLRLRACGAERAGRLSRA